MVRFNLRQWNTDDRDKTDKNGLTETDTKTRRILCEFRVSVVKKNMLFRMPPVQVNSANEK
jgi:hypothetical protein